MVSVWVPFIFPTLNERLSGSENVTHTQRFQARRCAPATSSLGMLESNTFISDSSSLLEVGRNQAQANDWSKLRHSVSESCMPYHAVALEAVKLYDVGARKP